MHKTLSLDWVFSPSPLSLSLYFFWGGGRIRGISNAFAVHEFQPSDEVEWRSDQWQCTLWWMMQPMKAFRLDKLAGTKLNGGADDNVEQESEGETMVFFG